MHFAPLLFGVLATYFATVSPLPIPLVPRRDGLIARDGHHELVARDIASHITRDDPADVVRRDDVLDATLHARELVLRRAVYVFFTSPISMQ